MTIVDATHKAVDGIEPIAKAREEFQGARKLIDKIWVDFKAVQTLSDGERQQIQAFEAQMLKSLPIIENLERHLSRRIAWRWHVCARKISILPLIL